MITTFNVHITGDNKKDIGRIIREIAFGIEAAMKLSMTQPKHGREYKRGGSVHIASAPGEAPAVDTGFLINSIQTMIKSDTKADIVIGAEYAEALEFGSSKMAARPFVQPAIDDVLKRVGRSDILRSLRE